MRGLRVVESAGWNGVFGGRLLADGGAEVIRVVPPAGDPLDNEPPFFGDSGVSIQAAWYNAGKRIVQLDPATPDGRRQLTDLLRGADILIEDWLPAEPLLSGGEIAAANARLARVSVTAMGLDGPHAGFKVNDLVANALCGWASVSGNAETPPLTAYGNQAHHAVGFYVAICALAALRAARADGTPQHVDLSAHEALVSCTEQVLMQWFFPEGTWRTAIAQRQGSLHWSKAYEIYPARDGRDVMVTASLRFGDVLLPWLKEDGAAQDLADEDKFPTLVSMIRNLPYVMNVMRDWVATYDGEALFYEAQRRHQPYGVVWSVQEAIEKSPQIAARGYLQPALVPGFGSVPFPGPVVRTSGDGPRAEPGVGVAPDAVGWQPRTGVAAAPASSHASTASLPLTGVRVLDFTHVLAGPFGTRVLADLGADVIKVSSASRGGGANTPDHPYFVMWNRNKRNMTINMALAEGREVARRLANKCDLIIENFSAGVLKRWGLDRDALKAGNPGVSVISMGGMGQSGPWKDFVTFAPTIHALTGLTYLTNPRGRHDLGHGVSLTDHLSGLAGAFAAIESLEHRERSGEGLDIDLSQYELGLGLMAPALLDYLANGVNPEPKGNRHPFAAWAPHGIYRCAGADRWVAIAVRGDEEWRRLCELIGNPALAYDGRFATHSARVANEDALDAVMESWTRSRDRFAVMGMLQAGGIAAGAVQDAEDLTRRDAQLAAREFFTTAPVGGHGLERFPARFDGRRPERNDGVRQLGEDTFDIATGLLGLDDATLAAWMAQGVFT